MLHLLVELAVGENFDLADAHFESGVEWKIWASGFVSQKVLGQRRGLVDRGVGTICRVRLVLREW
jgi:hypothetical protein